MVRVFIGLGVVALGLLIYCMVECIQTPRHRVRVLPKAAWIFIILLLPLLGPGLWMAFGRAKAPPAQAPKRKGPTAPDDDPEFLRKVEFERRQQQRREQEARKRNEQSRKHREAEQRAKDAKRKDSSADGADPRPSADERGTAEDEDPEGGTEPQRG